MSTSRKRFRASNSFRPLCEDLAEASESLGASLTSSRGSAVSLGTYAIKTDLYSCRGPEPKLVLPGYERKGLCESPGTEAGDGSDCLGIAETNGVEGKIAGQHVSGHLDLGSSLF